MLATITFLGILKWIGISILGVIGLALILCMIGLSIFALKIIVDFTKW